MNWPVENVFHPPWSLSIPFQMFRIWNSFVFIFHCFAIHNVYFSRFNVVLSYGMFFVFHFIFLYSYVVYIRCVTKRHYNLPDPSCSTYTNGTKRFLFFFAVLCGIWSKYEYKIPLGNDAGHTIKIFTLICISTWSKNVIFYYSTVLHRMLCQRRISCVKNIFFASINIKCSELLFHVCTILCLLLSLNLCYISYFI